MVIWIIGDDTDTIMLVRIESVQVSHVHISIVTGWSAGLGAQCHAKVQQMVCHLSCRHPIEYIIHRQAGAALGAYAPRRDIWDILRTSEDI